MKLAPEPDCDHEFLSERIRVGRPRHDQLMTFCSRCGWVVSVIEIRALWEPAAAPAPFIDADGDCIACTCHHYAHCPTDCDEAEGRRGSRP